MFTAFLQKPSLDQVVRRAFAVLGWAVILGCLGCWSASRWTTILGSTTLTFLRSVLRDPAAGFEMLLLCAIGPFTLIWLACPKLRHERRWFGLFVFVCFILGGLPPR